MFSIFTTDEFDSWLEKLKDSKARAMITKRIIRASMGNFGDHKFLRDSVWEMRIDTGKGYRVYYAQRGETIYLLINGGDKTTQSRDIENAISMLKQIQQQD